jgi:hypothetical protein
VPEYQTPSEKIHEYIILNIIGMLHPMWMIIIFEPLVKKIIESNESYFITGAGGCGKSTLINMLKQKIREGEDDDEAVEVMKDTSAVKIKNNITAENK